LARAARRSLAAVEANRARRSTRVAHRFARASAAVCVQDELVFVDAYTAMPSDNPRSASLFLI